VIFRRKRPVGGALRGDERDLPPLDFVRRDPLDDRPAPPVPAPAPPADLRTEAPSPTNPPQGGAATKTQPGATKSPASTTSGRQITMPASPIRPAAPGFKPLRPSDALGRRETSKSADVDDKRRLIVGRDISLAGEITACDYLVVEGAIDARLRDGRSVDISDGGVFRGSATVDEASIGGRFEGELTVRGRLSVRSTGLILGTVRYGELEVESGGRIVGTVAVIEPEVTAVTAALTSSPEANTGNGVSADGTDADTDNTAPDVAS
jgi:cytoskeletal protein CcmA (bactofilin family)